LQLFRRVYSLLYSHLFTCTNSILDMVFSALSAVILGLAASTLAYPNTNAQTAYQLAQMEELKIDTEIFLDTYPRDRMVAMQRAVSSVTAPLLAGCEDVFF